MLSSLQAHNLNVLLLLVDSTAVFYACVGKCDSTKPPEIVGSRYSDIGVARIVREDELQQGVFDTTGLIGLNWSEVI